MPLANPQQLALGVAACVVGLAAFFPQVVDASETSIRYHHLDHAGHFFLGVMLGLVLGSLPTLSRRLGERSALGLTVVVAAPTLMMLVMVPRFYEPLERHPFEHALYHLAMAALRPRDRPRRHPARPRHRPARRLPRRRHGPHVRRRNEMKGEQPMSDPATGTHPSSDGLWRWLLGGLAAGGVILGLLIAAYAIGYHRGQHHPSSAAAPTAPPRRPRPTPTTSTTASPTIGPVAVTPALVARGKALYTADGCSACHSLTGSSGVGPSFKGLAGSTVTLTSGQTVTADDAYLERSIADPDAQIVKGYRAGVMSAAIASYDLNAKPDDIRALVAFIKSQK